MRGPQSPNTPPALPVATGRPAGRKVQASLACCYGVGVIQDSIVSQSNSKTAVAVMELHWNYKYLLGKKKVQIRCNWDDKVLFTSLGSSRETAKPVRVGNFLFLVRYVLNHWQQTSGIFRREDFFLSRFSWAECLYSFPSTHFFKSNSRPAELILIIAVSFLPLVFVGWSEASGFRWETSGCSPLRETLPVWFPSLPFHHLLGWGLP